MFCFLKTEIKLLVTVPYTANVATSVADPDPNSDPSDPYGFGPRISGSGSTS